jgi:hypothetical protein
MDLGPIQPPIQWVPRALSLGVKRAGREADHLPPSSAEVKECVELYLHSPIRLYGVVLSYKKKGTETTLPYFYVVFPLSPAPLLTIHTVWWKLSLRWRHA